MSHIQQINFVNSVKEKYPNNFNNSKVLEVGSLDINGSVRPFFVNCEYVGVDVSEGPGVDRVEQGQSVDDPDGSYDTVISCECFEHNPYWKETFSNMVRLCSSGGLVIFSCATTGRPEHGTTRTSPQDSPLTIGLGWDYYKNLEEKDFIEFFDLSQMFSEWHFSVDEQAHDLYFFGLLK